MRKLLFSLFLLSLPTAVPAQQLLPQTKQVTMGKGYFTMGKGTILYNKVSTSHGDEYYALHITPDTLLVAYGDSAGLYYAHQTIEQLTQKGRLPVCDIHDWPNYPWRGCMIDVSRHFYPISFLKKQVDVLSHYKINRLHLHLTDAAGWRMPIDRYPLLTQRAAWRTESDWTKWWVNNDRRYVDEGTSGAYGGYYTKAELRDLVAYARKRGVTVVPEIEMPGHSEELTAVYPELKCEGNSGAQGDVCPSNEATYAFLHNVLDEVLEVFPSHWIHIGGDEAGKDHWLKCPRCQQKAKLLGLRSVRDLQGYLIQRMADYLRLQGREVIGWDEVLDDSLSTYAPSLGSNVNVMVWRSLDAARRGMKRGHNAILTPGEYYLDRYQDAPTVMPYAFGGYMPLKGLWERINPADFSDNSAKGRVLGVQGNMWTEYITTPDYAEQMLYPRMLAIAEVGWSGRNRPYTALRQSVIAQYPWLAAHKVNAFDLRKETGERKERTTLVRHKALGAKVTYNMPWSPYYPGKKDSTLIDGYGGGWSYGDGSWQGFCQSGDTSKMPFDVTIDLGCEQHFSKISLDFLQSQGAWVYYPSRLTIATSADGSHFTTVIDKTYTWPADQLFAIRTFSYPLKGQARYVRIAAQPLKPGQWVFTDEVKVQ